MNNNEIERKAIVEKIQRYISSSPYKLNPNDKTVERVVKGLVARKVKYGYEYCPCRLVSGDREKDMKIICPCVYHREEIERDGKCHCDLFVAP